MINRKFKGGIVLAGRLLVALCILAVAGAGLVDAANYFYEKASVKGIGYKNVEMIVSTQYGFGGVKLVEKESGSGNVITEGTELEAERQLNHDGSTIGTGTCVFPTGEKPVDYINFTKEAEFEYMPVSYQTGTYDQKWVEKLCIQNYMIGSVLTEMYTHVEHLQKSDELKTRVYGIGWVSSDIIVPSGSKERISDTSIFWAPLPISEGGTFDPMNPDYAQIIKITEKPKMGYVLFYATPNGLNDEVPPMLSNVVRPSKPVVKPGYTQEDFKAPCCNGVLEANLNSNVIGVAHIGWISRDPSADNQLKGRHAEYGRSVEDLTGVFSIEKFIQLWGNSTCGAISVDWLPCV
jgi:hypothetical protein